MISVNSSTTVAKTKTCTKDNNSGLGVFSVILGQSKKVTERKSNRRKIIYSSIYVSRFS